jgi:hypothetical protein
LGGEFTDHELYKELLLLNFQDQYSQFKQQINKAPASLIIINGEKKAGVEMLMDKLINPVINQQNLSIDTSLIIELNGRTGILSPVQIWQELARYFKVSEDKILSKIKEKCLERSIIMIFKIDNDIPITFLNDIIIEVFHPILKNELEGNKCLIFFLDKKQQLSNFEHEKFCKLSAKKFTQKNIQDWINDVEQRFSPKKLSPAFSTADSKSIYQNNQRGNPHLVYKDIYQIFDITWHNSEVYRRVS